MLVLDRARFPREKLCGDTLNPGALAVLRRLGLGHVADGGLPLDGMILTGGSNVAISGRYRGVQGRAIRRRELDAGLLAAARIAGASVDEGVLVAGPVVESRGSRPSVTGLTIKGRDGRSVRIAAPIVIAADGRYSRVARALGLSRSPTRPRRWAVGAYFTDVANVTTFGEMHVRCGHYLGVAPIGGGLANACIVSSGTGDLRDPSSFLLRALRSDVQLAGRFAGARMVAPAVSLGPLAVECRAAGVTGLLIAGDAGGFVDPMTGDGLRFAIRGGEQAALVACRALDGRRDDAHVDLLAMRRREFARKWRFNRAMRALVGSPSAVRVATHGAPFFPALFRGLISYAGDCS